MTASHEIPDSKGSRDTMEKHMGVCEKAILKKQSQQHKPRLLVFTKLHAPSVYGQALPLECGSVLMGRFVHYPRTLQIFESQSNFLINAPLKNVL